MKYRQLLFASFIIVIYSCHSQSAGKAYGLPDRERHYSDSMRIDSSVIQLIRTKTDSALKPLPAKLDIVLDMDFDSTGVYHTGLLFNSSNDQTENIVTDLYKPLKEKGYTVFVLVQNFGIRDKPDVIAVMQCLDKYEILKQVQTNGINWSIDNDSLIKIIKNFDDKYSLDLIGAGGDWCEFTINGKVENWLLFAKEAYEACPDIVDQGAGTVEKLAAEMKRTNKLYFWWD